MEGVVIAECKNCYHSECIPFTDGVYCHLNEVISFRVCSDYEGEFRGVESEPEICSAGTAEVLRILEGG